MGVDVPYPQEGNIESDQLYLPVNRPVLFYVRSEDVIHSFWVVQLGIKVDANPGEIDEDERASRIGSADTTFGAPNCAACCTRTWRPTRTSSVHPTSIIGLTANGGHVS